MPEVLGGVGSHFVLTCLSALLLAVALLNALAYWRAYAMTRQRFTATVPRGEPGTPAEVGLAYETHRLAGPDGELAAWFIPHPRPRGVVVLCHGFQCWKVSQLAEARAYHELGHACFLFDFRGWGHSQGNACTVGYREAEDVLCVLRHARRTRARRLPLILHGHSMGSAAALRALSLCGGSSGEVKADAAVLECPFDRLLHAVKARLWSLGIPPFPLAQLILFWGSRQHRFNGFGHNPVDYARRVTRPVLLLAGTEDRQVPPRQIEAIARNLGGPREVHLFQGLEHQPYVRAQPEEWKARVREFLASRDWEMTRRRAA